MKKRRIFRICWKKHAASKTFKDFATEFFNWWFNLCVGASFRQFLLNALELQEKYASAISSAILIFLTAILTGFGIFHKIAKFAGAGTFVPITGFANSVVAPALEFKTKKGLV